MKTLRPNLGAILLTALTAFFLSPQDVTEAKQFQFKIDLNPFQPIPKQRPFQQPIPPQQNKLPSNAAEAEAVLVACQEKDKVLWQYVAGLMCMREGNFAHARKYFEQSLATVDNRFGKDHTAQRARGYFSKEAKKTFIGEPYERAMANYYLGILYWMDEGPNRARPCFKNALFEDSYVGDEKYASDYVLCEYLDALGAVKLGENGLDSLAHARLITNTITIPPLSAPELPEPDAKANVLVFIEFGRGPFKYATGQYKEELRMQRVENQVHSAKLSVGDQTYTLTPYDDLFFQAGTRGGRVMDHINYGKAVFKQNTDHLGNLSLVSAAVASAAHADERITLGLAAFGALNKILSGAATAEADTRCWYNLPQYLSFIALKLPPGNRSISVNFADGQGRQQPNCMRRADFEIKENHDTVLFFSDKTD